MVRAPRSERAGADHNDVGHGSVLCVQPEDPSRNVRRGDSAAALAAEIGHTFHELRVGSGETMLVPSNVVFEPRATVTAHLEAPAIDLELMTADAGSHP